MKRWVVPAVLSAAAAAVVGACAYGSDSTDPSVGGYVPDGGGGGEGGTSHHDAAAGAQDAGGTPPPIDAAVQMDDAGGGDAGTYGMDGGPPGGVPCDSPDACGAGAKSIGTVAGDSSSNPVSATGTTSQWLTLDVTENDSGVFGVPMNLSVTLTSPAGENFDLYLYRAGNASAIECTKVAGSSANPSGQADTVAISWGEMGTFSNGSDDSAHVSIEVRSAPGNTCDPSASWSLTARGN